MQVVTLEEVSFSDTQNRDILTQPIQMQLSQKQKTFSQSFFAFLKFMLNLKHLRRKDGSRS